jgi:hypothetical protein
MAVGVECTPGVRPRIVDQVENPSWQTWDRIRVEWIDTDPSDGSFQTPSSLSLLSPLERLELVVILGDLVAQPSGSGLWLAGESLFRYDIRAACVRISVTSSSRSLRVFGSWLTSRNLNFGREDLWVPVTAMLENSG